MLRAANLDNNATLRQQDGCWMIQGDPTEGALLVAARKMGLAQADLEQRFPRIGEVPKQIQSRQLYKLRQV